MVQTSRDYVNINFPDNAILNKALSQAARLSREAVQTFALIAVLERVSKVLSADGPADNPAVCFQIAGHQIVVHAVGMFEVDTPCAETMRTTEKEEVVSTTQTELDPTD